MKLGLSNTVRSQVSGEWTPVNISSLIHWYKYDTGITKDSEDDVTAWNDQKGSNNLTADGVSANSPLYSSGAIHFNSTADLLSFGSTLNLGTFSIYFRFEVSSFGTTDFMLNPTGADF